MSEILDLEATNLPNTWMHRNPVKACALFTLVLEIGLLTLSWYLQPAFQYMNVNGNQAPSEIKEKYGVIMWVWNIIVLALIFLPPIVTQYMYRSGRERAVYLALFKRGAVVSFFGLIFTFIIIDRVISGWSNDRLDMIFGFISMLFIATVLALLLNLVLAIFFRK